MEIKLQILDPGADIDFFDIYTDYDNFTTKININPIPVADLLSGEYVIDVPEISTIVRACPLGLCGQICEDQECCKDMILTVEDTDMILEFVMTAPDLELTIPLNSARSYNMVINWGDGEPTSTVLSYNDPNATHTYSAAGTYRVSISGKCGALYFNNVGNKANLTKVIQWGEVGIESFENSFYGCSNLVSLPEGSITGADDVQSFKKAFQLCTSLATIPTDLFKNIIYNRSFESTFENCSLIADIPIDLFRYNVYVRDRGFYRTFYGCSSIISIPEHLFDYNVLCTSWYQCFHNCGALTGNAPELWITYPSANGEDCFAGCVGLTNYASIPTEWK